MIENNDDVLFLISKEVFDEIIVQIAIYFNLKELSIQRPLHFQSIWKVEY